MYRFKQFLMEKSESPSRMAPALRWGKDVVASKPGGAHSDLISHAKGKDKPDEMGFVRKHTGSNDVGPYKGRFFSRIKASELAKRKPHLLNDPNQAKDPPWHAQSYDFKPEGGRKKIREAIDYILEKENKNNKKKPTNTKKKAKKEGFVANKEAQHGGMSYYSPGEL